jgi:TRAF3-interacting protein 1
MSDNLEQAIKKTSDLLGQVIKKTPLNAKLLSRPPFRYFHDIFTEVIRTTGAFQGIYSPEELVSENVKVRNKTRIVLASIQFLYRTKRVKLLFCLK